MRYVATRLVQATFLLFGVSLLSFMLLHAAPGDFFADLRMNPQVSPETIARLRAQYDLDRPLPIRYGRWLYAALHGDLGVSFASGGAVAPLLLARAGNTLILTVPALGLSWLLALSLGSVWAAFRSKWLSGLLSLVLAMLLAIPELLLGLILLAIGVRSGWFPAGGMRSPGYADLGFRGQFVDLLRHLALPVLALVLGCLPVLVLHVRSALLEVFGSTYVRAAWGHGVSRLRIIYRHALPAALNPLISLFGFTLASLLSISLLTEVIMSWPGIGPLLLEAVLARDINVVVGAIAFSGILLVTGTAAADILLFVVDPRIRLGARV